MSALRIVLAPRMWGAHLLMVIVVGAAVSLGAWQYSNSAKAKEAQIDDLVHAEPRQLTDVMGGNDPFPGTDLGRPAVIEGQWLPEATVLVDGQDEAYWVATPVAVDGTESAIYVVRGSTETPDTVPEPPSGDTTLVGWLQPPQQDRVIDDNPDDDVLPQLDLTLVIDRAGQDLFSAYAVGTSGAMDPPGGETVNDGAEGLAAVEAPSPPEPDSTTGLRNLLYAIEWWLFGVLGLYIWVRYLMDVIRRSREDVTDEPAESDVEDEAVPSTS